MWPVGGGTWENLLPRKSKVAPTKHHPALPYARVPELLAGLRQRQGIAPRAVEFLVLTATRSGETRGARWGEIDFSAKTWAIPGGRMKGGKEHRVPLSGPCLAILEQMAALREGDDDLIFPGGKGRAPLSDVALTEIAKLVMPGVVFTIHGLRSSFRDWAGETTAYPREVIEMALAHRLGDKAEQAYARGDLFQKRRRLTDDWARFCANSSAKGGDVVPPHGPEIAA
jgi:integrase